MIAQFQREFNDPMKEIRGMDTEIGSLDADAIQKNWFKEEILIKDDDVDSYADIKIPDFHDGRQGRFIHDFKNNQTTIIDESANRCFVYPLDYETTSPPKSIVDIFIKMQTGYYFPDTNVLRKKMHVVIPELESGDDYISLKTADFCSGMKIYRLEPFVSGVFKRSINEKLSEHGVFAEFAGKGIIEFDLINIAELEAHERKN
jgi:integral membrane protein 2B